MLEEQIKNIGKYLKKKYPNRYTLKLDQVASEFLMDRKKIKELKAKGRLTSLSIKTVAAYIVENPARKAV